MKRVSAKVNLMQLNAVRKMFKGQLGEVECLVIPIEKNKLFVGEKGIYLDIVGFELKEPNKDSKDTHILKQSFSKEEREKMSDEQLKALPILGNMRIWEGTMEAEPVSAMIIQDEESDLPFN